MFVFITYGQIFIYHNKLVKNKEKKNPNQNKIK